MSIGDLAALGDRVAHLPTELLPEQEDAKRFDVLVLKAHSGCYEVSCSNGNAR